MTLACAWLRRDSRYSDSREKVASSLVSAMVMIAVVLLAIACKGKPRSGGLPKLGQTAETNALPVESIKPPSRPRRTAISLVQLIANPEYFDGARVAIAGYLTMDDVQNEVAQGSLSLSRDDVVHGLGNAVSLSFSKCDAADEAPMKVEEAINHKLRYVRVYGKFASGHGASPSPGVVCSIESIVDLEEWCQSYIQRRESAANNSSDIKKPACVSEETIRRRSGTWRMK